MVKYVYKVSGAVFVNHPVYNILQRKGSAIRSAYSPKILQSQIDAYEILIGLPENTPEVRKLMSISRTLYISMYITESLRKTIKGINAPEVAQIRKFLKPHAKEYLSYEKIPRKRKIKFLFGNISASVVWSFRDFPT